ncbi:hypothetical protein LX36DRAFT_184112 [Colletotrichum falcatum]|nr:hypothetical protein LX36DRAFT_184112 [Colletotrichum falcatum]
MPRGSSPPRNVVHACQRTNQQRTTNQPALVEKADKICHKPIYYSTTERKAPQSPLMLSDVKISAKSSLYSFTVPCPALPCPGPSPGPLSSPPPKISWSFLFLFLGPPRSRIASHDLTSRFAAGAWHSPSRGPRGHATPRRPQGYPPARGLRVRRLPSA